MISALQTKFQKHHKIVFFLLLAVIIVAFVFTIGAAPGFGGDSQTARRDFFGHNLASEREMRDIVRIGEIAFRIEFGDEQADPRHFEGFVFERLALLGLADRMGIPGPTDDQIRQFITGRRIFQDETGRFNPRRFNDFRDEVEANPQITEGEVATILAQSFRANKVRDLLGGPGYILPTEIRLQLERNQTLWTVDFGVIDLAELRAEVEVTEEELEQFFEENAFRYERSPRTVFSFVRFPPDRFFQQVQQPSQQDLEAHFERNRARFTPPPPANEDEATVAPEVTLADVRD
jgi:peptidyl-prolyl cis-trans isomerase D